MMQADSEELLARRIEMFDVKVREEAEKREREAEERQAWEVTTIEESHFLREHVLPTLEGAKEILLRTRGDPQFFVHAAVLRPVYYPRKDAAGVLLWDGKTLDMPGEVLCSMLTIKPLRDGGVITRLGIYYQSSTPGDTGREILPGELSRSLVEIIPRVPRTLFDNPLLR